MRDQPPLVVSPTISGSQDAPSLQEYEGRAVYGFAPASIHRDRGYLTGCHRAGARESSITCIQITTTSPASHKFAPLLVVKPFTPIPVGPWSGGNCVTILPPMPYPVQQPHEAAVYRTCIIVAFFRLPSAWHATHRSVLTALITVREKLVLVAPARSILAAMPLATVGLPRSPASASAEPFTSAQEYDEFYHGLDEVNLLEELSAASATRQSLKFSLI
ncbi:hypothetical protein EDB85DRAFT_1892330 [Lactarius pseudohatsudake]|nr:hypothetical protein EDB85DRAFT_1892330 [Lactarius pseudohatsudake]